MRQRRRPESRAIQSTAFPPLWLVDQCGDAFSFTSLAGSARLVGMFYGSCRIACPLEIETLKSIEHQVLAAGCPHLPVVLVGFDPVHDYAASLRRIAKEHQVSASEF